MIFKTITSSVDETKQSLALFNRDWNTYKTNWQNANGLFGKIGSVFSTVASPISSSDIQAIKAYNSQIDACVTSQTAFNRTMLNASPAAQNLVASYNGEKVSVQGMVTAQNAAKDSTIGLTFAQTALNAAIGMGIGLLINLVVQGVNKLIHANEEAIEKAEQLREKYVEFKNTNESNVNTLKGLENEFKELSKGVSQYGDNISLTTEQYERYKEIVQQIVGMSPSLAEGYDTENGYIVDKNGLLERAIELQEIEYRNELRKITNLENLKTSMSGYIAEYKEALNGGFITAEGNIVGTKIDTNFKNSLWQLFNTNNRENYDGQSMARDIIESLGNKDVDAEMQKYFDEYGNWQDNWFWNDYCDTIINNLNAVTDSLSFEEVGLDEDVFDQNLEKLESYAESYRDMKDSVEMSNNAIQTDLGYIAEYADGYSQLSTEQQKFVTDFLKGFDISDITSENAFGFLEYDNDKMASLKSQIKKFVEELSQDESTKEALADLYAIPTDEQSISEFVEQFRSALEIIKAYCEENDIEIPIAISDSEQTINDLEAQYQRAVDFAKDKFDGYDPTAFFKEHSINTQEEIDKWQKIAQGARDAAEAEKEYIQSSTLNENPISSFQEAWTSLDTTEDDNLKSLKEDLLSLAETGQLTIEKFKETGGSDSFLSMFGIDEYSTQEINSLISKINELKSSADQLSSMKKGISGLSENLYNREQEPDVAIDVDTLAGMDSVLKEQTAEWERYVAILGDASSSMDDVQKATDELATAYVNSNNFLANLTDANKDYYISQLDAMGVANSAEVVSERLTAQMEVEKYRAQAVSVAVKDIADSQASYTQRSVDSVNATYENSSAFLEQADMTDLAKVSLVNLIAQEQIYHSTTLSTSQKVNELNKLALAFLGVGKAVQISSAMGGDSRYWTSPEQYDAAVKEQFNNSMTNWANSIATVRTKPATKKNNSNNNNDSKEKKENAKEETQKEFSEVFDWIERRIKKFQNAFDKWLAQAETALTSKFLDIYYKKAATSAKNQLSSYDKAYNRYMREANAVGLDEKYAKKVRNGTINIEEIYAKGSEDDVKKYEELAKKIKDYQNWYDKAQDSMNSFREIAEKLYNLPLDKAAKKVDIFSDAIDLLNKELDNETDYKNKNKMIGNKGDKNKNTLSSYKKATLNSYKTAESDTEKALNNARKELRKSKNLNKDDGITAKERKIIKKATKSKDAKKNKEINLAYFKENSAGYKKAVKYNEALKAYKKAANDAASAQQDYNAWLVEASKLKFDNIADHYDKEVKIHGYKMSSYDNTISEIEASGRKVHKFHYESQRNINQNILSQYLAEKTDLEKSLNNITEGTDEWYDAYDKIQQVNTAISECKQKTCEFNNAINQLHFDMFDDISEGIERIVSEQEFLQGLFAHEKTTDKTTGNFTEAGLAKLGSLAVIHYAYEDDLERYSTEITELKRMLASGTLQSSTLGLTFNSRDDAEAYLEKMYDQYRDVKNKMYGIDTEIHNRMEEFYQTELDYLSELIGAKKEALNAEKDLHDYQRTISEKTEGIATIRKQIAAYSGDTSQEGMAKLQRLQKELTDREDDLKETEYNRLISDQQDMLDKLYDEYSQKLEEKMENFMVLVQEGLGKANDNMSSIRDYLEKIANDSKYDLEINGLFEGSGKIDTNVGNATSQIAKDKNAQYESTKPNVTTPAPTPKENTPKKNNKKNTNKKNNNKKKSSNNKKKSSNSKKKSSGSKKNGSQQEIVLKEFTPKRITPKTKQVLEISQDFLHLEPDIPFKDYRNQNSFIRDSLELETLTGNSLERTSNTYAVFDAKKPKISSEHILDATIPILSINDVVPDLSATPRINNVSNVVNIDSITLPNVTNYDEFKDRMFHDMQNDGHYIQFINDASVNRADGTGRLTKNTQTL